MERQIREAQERGAFDNLPGAGTPLPGLHRPHDENWWIKDKMRREGLSPDALLPEPLRLRKEIERLPGTVCPLQTEGAVRETVGALNRRIVAWLRAPVGPRIRVAPVDADAVVAAWKAARSGGGGAAESGVDEAPARPRRRRWWRRRGR